jgi:hypothetical protein
MGRRTARFTAHSTCLPSSQKMAPHRNLCVREIGQGAVVESHWSLGPSPEGTQINSPRPWPGESSGTHRKAPKERRQFTKRHSISTPPPLLRSSRMHPSPKPPAKAGG